MSTSANIFVLGVTGYIGGDAFKVIADAHPEWNYTCLVRNSDKGALVAKDYPKVRLVYGDLASLELIEKEATNADLVLSMASADDMPSIKAIAAGLAARQNVGFWIHLSGTGMITYPDTDKKMYGELSNKVWDDEDGILSLTTTTKHQESNKVVIPQHASHRKIEEAVLDAGADSSDLIKAAVVCPPHIYGTGRGVGNRRSIQLPDLIKYSLQRKQVFVVGDGEARWSNVHVRDLSDLFLLLSEAAVIDKGTKGSWRADHAYYFVENGENSWKELSMAVAKKAVAKKLLDTKELKSITAAEAEEIRGHGSVLWGTNSRSRAEKARKRVGWAPKHPSLMDSIDEALDIEAANIGLTKGHAEVAAGNA